MSKDNKKEKVRSVFNYKYFWMAIAIPIAVGLILMFFIWQNDKLSLERPSRESLETFVTFMSVPLWIMGSAIPFATLAAANFRAVQFQENLNYQKRNIERQEYEHALDLYHKELTIFKEKLTSVLLNEKYELIKPNDATMVFTRLYERPSRENLDPFKVNTLVVEHLAMLIPQLISGLKSIENLDTISNSDKICEIKSDLVKDLLLEYSEQSQNIAEKLDFVDFKILLFINNYEGILKLISHTLGIKVITLKTDHIKDILKFTSEIIRFYTSIESGENWPTKRQFDTELEVKEVNKILNRWLSETKIPEDAKLDDLIFYWTTCLL